LLKRDNLYSKNGLAEGSQGNPHAALMINSGVYAQAIATAKAYYWGMNVYVCAPGVAAWRTIRQLVLASTLLLAFSCRAENSLDSLLPVRGFCIAAPPTNRVDDFIRFIDEELAPRGVNTLVLQVDYHYQFTCLPEFKDPAGLSKDDAARLVAACKRHKIHLIPLIDLLGHQSWQSSCGALLRLHPEFDETPWVKFPKHYVWPNDDRLYCKSYCPLHPQVHDMIFALVDEICDAFEADAFHAGMDEVFYIGEDKCPRCSGKDKAELFAGEVRLIRDHLRQKNRDLWIWGDRLLDGKTTGLGEWEASFNGTDRAIDLIPRDVVICDWHYDRPAPTAVYFAMKGFRVVTCPYNKPSVAVTELEDVVHFREHATPEMQPRLLGIMQTVWSGSDEFMDRFKARSKDAGQPNKGGEVKCFVTLYDKVAGLSKPGP
jgi:hypothetical protein